jgi:hypothetical protein
MTKHRIPILTALVAGALSSRPAQAAPYGATYAPSPLACLTANQVKTHPVTLTNTGTLAWTVTRPGSYRLSYHWYQGMTEVVWDGERTFLPNQLDPGQSAALQASLKAPAALGTYTLQWDMLQEGVTWFSWEGVPTLNQTVEVKSSCSTFGVAAASDLGHTLTAPPKIEQVVPFISHVTPGGYIAIKGTFFGTAEGHARLRGVKRWNGTAYGGTGDIWLKLVEEPGKDFWNPTKILVAVPAHITQVMDQPVKLQVKNAAGLWSNDYDVQLIATKDLVTLPRTDSAVKLLSCGDDSNKDVCNGWVDSDDDDWFSSTCGQTFFGFHLNCWGCIGNDSGVDKFEITLKNGWLIDGGRLHLTVDEGEGYAMVSSDVPTGGTSWKPTITWNVTPNDVLCHGADVYITGPRGVPWE